MTMQDEVKFNEFLEKLAEEGDTTWIEHDLDDYPECQHPSIEDFF